MKKVIFFGLLITLLISVISLAFFWWKINSKPVSNEINSTRFVIPKGYSASQIAQKLYEERLIKNPLALKLYLQLTDKADRIQAGEYTLNTNLNLIDVVKELVSGPRELWITIPEGLRIEEIAYKFANGLGYSEDNYGEFITSFLTSAKGKEGYLFPDTYLFPKDIQASKIVGTMNSVFENKYAEVSKQASTNFTKEQIVTIASLIERETLTEEERPVVAGIIIKRLENNWALQVDAAVQYGVANQKIGSRNKKIDNYWEPLTSQDLDTTSPYNTYKFLGLPPGPISNPGLSSLKAALFPQESDYWFYLHDPKGIIHYARNIEEHNQNVRIYLGK